MAQSTIRVDNISPIIQYSPAGAWAEGTSATDNQFFKYFQSTFIVTQSKGATASISFHGSRIVLYGAKRGNHDLYNIVLNGNTQSLNGKASPDQFQAVLFDSGTTLSDGNHTIVVQDATTNSDPGQSFFDLDFIEITSTAGVKSIVAEDTTFAYSPSGTSWTTTPQNVTQFSGGNGHSTATPSATAVITFVGDGIDIFGLVGGTSGPYAVSVDGGPAVSFNAANTVWLKTQQLLYTARGLAPKQHTITLTNQPVSGSTLNIDYAQIFGSAPQIIPAKGSGGDSGSNDAAATAIIAVLAVLLVIAICVIGYLVVLLRRRRRVAEYAPQGFDPPEDPRYVVANPFPPANSFPPAVSESSIAPYTTANPTQQYVTPGVPARGVSIYSAGTSFSPSRGDNASIYPLSVPGVSDAGGASNETGQGSRPLQLHSHTTSTDDSLRALDGGPLLPPAYGQQTSPRPVVQGKR